MLSNRQDQDNEVKIAIDRLRQQYLNCIKERSKNSDDFDTNIRCLRELKKVRDELEVIYETNVVKSAPIKNHFNNFFSRDKAQKKLISAEHQFQLFINQFLGPIQTAVLIEFAKEPRITQLYYYREKIYNKELSLTTVRNNYRIEFLDGSEIKLYNLQGSSLKEARIIFNLKIIALSPKYQLVSASENYHKVLDGNKMKISDSESYDKECSLNLSIRAC